jgi:1-acyl-sn-glycerol-3-phosphate acyltransferase
VRKLGFWPRFAVVIVKPLMKALTRRDWRGMENIPPTGGIILAFNHVSHADPFTAAHYVYDSGRWPQFLAKESVFRIPVAGRIIHWCKQIPVHRGTVDAARALDAAIAAVEEGGCIVIYPEGTTTKEPNLWPMRGKTGVARLALATGVPVIPVAQFGMERLFDPRTKKIRPWRTPVQVWAGPPIDLSKWAGSEATGVTLAEMTEEIMNHLRLLVGEMRGETPPPIYSPAAAKNAVPTPNSAKKEA